MKKPKRLTDVEVLAVVDHLARDAAEYETTTLSTERAEALQLYRGELPRPQAKGISTYVSLDVYDAVEGLKSQILDTFAKGRDLVQFRPRRLDAAAVCEQRTRYTSYCLFDRQQTADADPLDTWVFTALYARTAVVKVWWETRRHTRVIPLQLTPDQYTAILDDPEIKIRRETAEWSEEAGVYEVEIEETREEGELRWAPIPPEEFRVSPWARTLDDATYLAHVTEATLTELREQDLAPDLLTEIAERGERVDVTADLDLDEMSRTADVAVGSRYEDRGAQEAAQRYRVHEAYVVIDPDGTGRARLHRVVRTGGILLEVTEVDDHPFVAFTPLPIPHRLLGHSFVGTVVHTQKTKTALIRGVVDHTVTTARPRYQVVNGTIQDARELLDNRAGGIVNVNRPDGILPLTAPPLNPYVTQILGLLDYRKEQDTGISMLSTGLNSDAISKQNSRGLVQDMVQLGQVRQRQIARRLGRAMVALYRKAADLINRHEDPAVAQAVLGTWDQVDPEAWVRMQDCIAELHLGYGEQERQANELIAFDQLMLTDPGKAPLYTLAERKQVMTEYLRRKGFGHMTDALIAPNPEPPQPDPVALAQLDVLKAEAQAKAAEAETKRLQAQLAVEKAKADLAHKREQLERKFDLDADRLDLDERKQAHAEHVAEEELKLAAKATDLRAIASPT